MKKFLRPLLLLTALIAACIILNPTEARAASVDDLTFTLNSDGASYSVTNCNTAAVGTLAIPDTHNDKPVTAIGTGAFMDCKLLTKVTMGKNLKTIQSNAFKNCKMLTEAYIAATITQVGDGAFMDCTGIEEVVFAPNVQQIQVPGSKFHYVQLVTATTASGSTQPVSQNPSTNTQPLQQALAYF